MHCYGHPPQGNSHLRHKPGECQRLFRCHRYELRKQLNTQHTQDARTETIAPTGGLPDSLQGNEPQFVKDYFNYYKTPRGFHARSINSNGAWNATSSLSFMNMPLLTYADEIRSAVLIVHGEKAHSRYFSEDAFKKL